VITCAAALNLCFNVSGAELLIETISTDLEFFDDGHATKAKQWFNESLKEKFNKRAKNDRSLSSEYERYVNEDFIQHLKPNEFAGFDVLGFWKAKETLFPVLSRMTMDIISVQPTSLASEFAFSTSGKVLSIRRTRLTPASLEMCMCLKDHLDATERIQHTSNLENALDFEEEILDAEVQENEAIALSDEEIAQDGASHSTRSNESGSGGEEFDYDLTLSE
ncbi:zinc finger BED domain-containing protein RICESLEEPER 2, partial [Tanacetum coccineum]